MPLSWKNRGFEIIEMLIVPHGGHHNDTIVTVEVRNQGGEDITTTGATVTFNSPTGALCGAGTGTGAFSAGSTQVITFGSCTGLSSGKTMSADIIITYTRPDSTLGLQSTGTVSGKVA